MGVYEYNEGKVDNFIASYEASQTLAFLTQDDKDEVKKHFMLESNWLEISRANIWQKLESADRKRAHLLSADVKALAPNLSMKDAIEAAAGKVGSGWNRLECLKELAGKDTGWRLLGSGSSNYVFSDIGTVTFSYRFVARRIGALGNAWWTTWQSAGTPWEQTTITASLQPSGTLSRIVPASVLLDYPHYTVGTSTEPRIAPLQNSGTIAFPVLPGGHYVQARNLPLSSTPPSGSRSTAPRGAGLTDAPFPDVVQGTLVANEAGDSL